jgi:ATP-dependent helicase/DNAse subunit B
MTDPLFASFIRTHVFTATDLENFRLCPYRFYASAFLKLRQEDPLEVELTPAEIGSLVHKVLERLFVEGSAAGPSPLFPENILNEELGILTADRPHLSRPLLTFQKRRIERMLASFVEDLERERAQASDWQPRFFEWSFGGDRPPLALKDADGHPVSFRGRIDRIDVNERLKRFLVVDYKTGSTRITGNQIKSGESLQLPLYLLAVQRLLLRDYEPAGAVYYQLSDMSKRDGLLHAERRPEHLDVGPRSSSCIPAAKWDEVLESIESKAGEVVSEIRNARAFASSPEPCEPFCPYQDICRMRSCEL